MGEKDNANSGTASIAMPGNPPLDKPIQNAATVRGIYEVAMRSKGLVIRQKIYPSIIMQWACICGLVTYESTHTRHMGRMKGEQMDRINRLRQQMAAEQVDFVAVGAGAHMAWLAGIRPHSDERPLLLCVSPSYAGLLMPSLEAESVRQHTSLPFHCWSDNEGPVHAFRQLLTEAGAENASSLVLDETMRADFAALVQDALPQASRQFCTSTVGALRLRKGDDEYTLLKQSARVADQAMQQAWAGMKPGMTELDVAAIIKQSFKDSDAHTLFTIVGTGANGAFPHHQTGNTVLQPGDAVVMDIGANHQHYPSDITRSAVIGHKPEGYDEIHALVENAVQAAMAAAKPGVKASDVDQAARSVIESAGYGEYFMHRLGHGLGIEVHEPPYLTTSSQTVLEEGMVFSIEPGIYLPNRFGIRLEDIVILRADGPEILSELPRYGVVVG